MRIIAAALTLAVIFGLGACGSIHIPQRTVTHTHTVTPAPQTHTQTVTPPPAPPASAPAAPAPAPAPQVTDPWAVVSAYYGDIDAGNYAEAWQMTGPAFRAAYGPYDTWVAGYANTGAETLSLNHKSGDQVSVSISAVDTRTGNTQYFTGSLLTA